MATSHEAATDYTPSELMTVQAARELPDGAVVFVGIGLPNLACNLARATHAPNLCMIYESGAVGAIPDRVPPSIGDPSLVTGSLMVASMGESCAGGRGPSKTERCTGRRKPTRRLRSFARRPLAGMS